MKSTGIWFILGLAFALPLQGARGDSTDIVTLKPAAKVDGTHVRIGDLFDNAGAHADDAVAPSPALGASVIYPGNWLQSIAQSHGLLWQPPSPFASIRVERAATVLSGEQIAEQLAAALDISGPDRRVILDNKPRLFAPLGETAAIGIENLAFDKETGRFSAEIRASAGDQTAVPVRVMGRVQSLVEVAVLTRPISPGDVIRPGDVTTSWERAELTPAGSIVNAKEMIGMTPRRPLRANVALRAGDVETPILIRRNDLVLITLESPGMFLTASGKALENGGLGNVIRVTNVQSGRTIDVVVTGSGRVAVRSLTVASAAAF